MSARSPDQVFAPRKTLASSKGHDSPKTLAFLGYHGFHARVRFIDEIPLIFRALRGELGLKCKGNMINTRNTV